MSDIHLYLHPSLFAVNNSNNSKRANLKRESQKVQRAKVLAPYLYYETPFRSFFERVTERGSNVKRYQAMANVSLSVVKCMHKLFTVAAVHDLLIQALTKYIEDVMDTTANDGSRPMILIKDVYMFLKDFMGPDLDDWGNLVLGVNIKEDGPEILSLMAKNEPNIWGSARTPTNIMNINSGGNNLAYYRCLYLPVKSLVYSFNVNNKETKDAIDELAQAICEADKIFFEGGINGKSTGTLLESLKNSVRESKLIDNKTKRKLVDVLERDIVLSLIGILNVERVYNLLNEVLKSEAGSINHILTTPTFKEAVSYLADLMIIYSENGKVSEALKNVFQNSPNPLDTLTKHSLTQLPEVFPVPESVEYEQWVTKEVMARLQQRMGANASEDGTVYDYSGFHDFVEAYCTKHPENDKFPLPNISDTVSFSALSKLTSHNMDQHKKTVLDVFMCAKTVLYALNENNLSEETRAIIEKISNGVEMVLSPNLTNLNPTQYQIYIYTSMRSCVEAILMLEKSLTKAEREEAYKYFNDNFPKVIKPHGSGHGGGVKIFVPGGDMSSASTEFHHMDMLKYNELLLNFIKELGVKTVSNQLNNLYHTKGQEKEEEEKEGVELGQEDVELDI